MYKVKTIVTLIISIFFTFIFVIGQFALAETKEIFAEGEYNMGDGETRW